MLPFGLGYLNIISLTTTDTLAVFSGSNVDPILSLLLGTSRVRFYYNSTKEVNVFSKFTTTDSIGLGKLGHFRIVEPDRRKWGNKLRDEARREGG